MSDLSSCLAALAVASTSKHPRSFSIGLEATAAYVGCLPGFGLTERAGLVILQDAYSALMLDSEVALAIRDDIRVRISLIDEGGPT